MRKIKDVIVTVNSAVGNVNTTSHLVVLKQAGSFNIEVTEEEVYDPNEIIIIGKRTHPKGKKKADAKPKPVAAPVPDFDWIWSSMVKSGFQSSDKNASLKGNKFSLKFPRVLEGGGLAWLEPFIPGYEPTTKIPNGYFITAKGEPKILSAAWREYSEKNDGKIINGTTRKFKDSVQLHIYTQGLYGHDVEVTLMDHDYMPGDSDDTLNVYSKDTKASPIAYFTTEVRVFAMLGDESSISPIVSDSLASEKTESGKQLNPAKFFVQKTVLDVYVDKLWINDGGSSLEIYPKVKIISSSQETTLQKVYIKVEGEADKDSALSMTGNKPVVVDEIPTDMGSYAPCKYTAVKLSIPEKNEKTGKDEVKALYLYKQGDSAHRNLRPFEVVTGEIKNLKKITIELEDVQTLDSDCFEAADHKHKGRVLKLTSYPEKTVDSNPNAKEVKSDLSTTGKSSLTSFSLSNKQESGDSKPAPLQILSNTDSMIEFNTRFIYDKTPIKIDRDVSIHWIMRYFWLGKNVIGKPYIVLASTCRHEQRIEIIPYPDVVWELALELKVSKKDKPKNYAFNIMPEPAAIKVGPKSELTLALHGTWDDEKFDLTADLKDNIVKKVKKFAAFGEMIESVFLGKNNNDASGHRRPNADALATMEEARKKFAADQVKDQRTKNLKQVIKDTRSQMSSTERGTEENNSARADMSAITSLVPDIKRDIAGIDIEWPEITLSFSWCRVNVNSQQRDDLQNQTAILLTGKVEAKPLIGLSAYLDFLALIQRVHPIALAVIAVADLTMALIGDGSKITCELRAKGTLGGKVEGFLNTLTKENSFNKADRDTNGKPIATITGDLEFTVKIEIKIEVRKDYVFVAVEGSAEASIEAKAKWSARGVVDCDLKGYYTMYYGTFEGLEIVGKAKIEGKVSGERDIAQAPSAAGAAVAPKKESNSLFSGSAEKSLKFQAIDKQEEKELGKLYFSIG